MKIDDFKLERYFAKHEFTAKYLLSSSDCDGFDMKYILDGAASYELELWHRLRLGYTESAGNPVLREAVLQHYDTKSIDHVVVASPGELNFITMNVLLQPTDHVVAVAPCYQSLTEVVRSIGCRVSSWLPDAETWAFDTSELDNLVTDQTKLIILNFPHNPTGSYLSREQLDDVVAIAEKHDAYIFSDEMYRRLLVDHLDELPSVCDVYSKGISLWGTSKSFGLAGLRTGWLVASDVDFLRKVVAFKDYLSICTSAPAEILSLIALNHIDRFVNPNIEKIRNNVQLFEQFVARHPVFASFVAPKSGSTAFVKLNIDGSSLAFCDQLVEQTGIMTVPAEMFNYSGNYIRIGFGRKNMPEILELLDGYLTTRSY